MNKINTAIIGFGMSGQFFHAPIINSVKELNLVKIFTSNKANQELIRIKYPQISVASSVENIINDETIHLVIIATPNSTHYSLAEKAIKAKKNVVIDKPFTVSTIEATNLIALAEKHDVILTVYHNRRWDSDFKTIKKVVESKILGAIVECEIHMDRYRNYSKNNWKERNDLGSGLLYDLGPHMIDQALNLFGMPSEVFADLRIQREFAKTTDNFELILNYDLMKVTLKAGMLVKSPLPKYTLIGNEGTFIKYGCDVQEEDLFNGYTPRNKMNWGQEPEESYGKISVICKGLNIDGSVQSDNGDYRDFYINLSETISGKSLLAVSPLEALNTIMIIEQSIISNNTGKKVELK